MSTGQDSKGITLDELLSNLSVDGEGRLLWKGERVVIGGRARHGKDDAFLQWLVPARGKIQTVLLAILLHCEARDFPKRQRDDEARICGLSIGIAFSLWRACFQADKALVPAENFRCKSAQIAQL